MSSLTLTLKLSEDQATIQDRYQKTAGEKREALRELADLFQHAAGGIKPVEVDVQTASADPVAASNTLTLASVLADDTVTIGGVTFTAKASPASETEFDQSGNDTADATSLAAKIAAHSTLGQIVTATSSAAVVTVTAHRPGVWGNFVTISQTGGTITIGGSGAALESGAGGDTEAAVNHDQY